MCGILFTQHLVQPRKISCLKRLSSAMILPLLKGYDTVSHPQRTCIPISCQHLGPSSLQVALMSTTTQFQRSICTLQCNCIFQYTNITNTSVSSLRIMISFLPNYAACSMYAIIVTPSSRLSIVTLAPRLNKESTPESSRLLCLFLTENGILIG